MFIIHNNVETEVFPVVDDDGVPVVDGNGKVYMTEAGERVTLVFTSEAPEPDEEPTLVLPTRPDVAKVDGQLWGITKTKFFIGSYKHLKERLQIKGGFRTKKALWQELADTVVGEFGGALTAEQAENKWKSLERAYKKAKLKNSSSGHSRVHFEYEDELHDILEKEHHIRPIVLLAPGKVLEKAGEMITEGEDSRAKAGPSTLSPEEAPSQRASGSGAPTKRKRETALGSLLKVLAEMVASRKQRHAERMAILERLVTAIERSSPSEQ